MPPSDIENHFYDTATTEGATMGDFLLKIANHLRSEIARGGTDVDLLVSRIRSSANDLEELAYAQGAKRPEPTGPVRTVVASPHPSNMGAGGGGTQVGGWGNTPVAQPPMRLPPNTLPVPVNGSPEGNAVVVDEPAPGENAILDMHRANLSALGVPRIQG